MMNCYASAHCRFGEALELNEQQWLVWEINQHLKEARGRAPELADMPYTDAPEVGGKGWGGGRGRRGGEQGRPGGSRQASGSLAAAVGGQEMGHPCRAPGKLWIQGTAVMLS
jgi:hypothetical protein